MTGRQRSALASVLFGVVVAAVAFVAAYLGTALTPLGAALLAGAAGLVPPAIERLWDHREPLLTIGLLVGALVMGAGAFTQRPVTDPPIEAHYPPTKASSPASTGAASTAAAPSATVPASPTPGIHHDRPVGRSKPDIR